MARTTEQVLREMLGTQAIQIASLVSENETLKEELAQTKPLAEVPRRDDQAQTG